jgi:hypothetical protein
MNRRKIVFYIYNLAIASVLITISPIPINTAFGDGLFMEELSASFGNRKADLLIKRHLL